MSTTNLQLSPHFTLKEFTKSKTAARLGISNQPNEIQLSNLYRLAKSMEAVRYTLSEIADREIPILCSSVLRVPELNSKTPGSSKTSLHQEGLACDFEAPEFGTPYEIAICLSNSDLVFEELIYEYREWVHFALARVGERPKRECFTRVAGMPLKHWILDI